MIVNVIPLKEPKSGKFNQIVTVMRKGQVSQTVAPLKDTSGQLNGPNLRHFVPYSSG